MEPTRLLTGLVLVALLAVGLVILLPDCASACSCGGGGGSQKEIVEWALSDSEAVFSGEVVDFETPPTTTAEDFRGKMWTIPGEGPATATLRVSEVWKGPKQQTVEITTASNEAMCGYSFEEGREYLVYAYGGQDLKVDLCSETKLLSKAGADLALLGDGERPGDDAPLPDTSGGVAGLGVLGLAGVATTTAAFLLLKRLLKS